MSSALLYLEKIYEHILLENSIGLDGLALPFFILEICDASNTIYFAISFIFILSVFINVFKLLLYVVKLKLLFANVVLKSF